MLQSWVLGMVTLAILVLQTGLIPKLRGRLRKLALQRQLTARDLSGRVSEIVDGATDIRLNDGTNFERSDIADRLARIFFIRFDFYQWKFMVKFINNFLAQFTPFVFYLGGGILAIRGSLDIGQLVAVIAAYKDLPGPVKELIDWDYQRLDVQVKYLQVVNAFDITPLAPAISQEVKSGKCAEPAGAVRLPSGVGDRRVRQGAADRARSDDRHRRGGCCPWRDRRRRRGRGRSDRAADRPVGRHHQCRLDRTRQPFPNGRPGGASAMSAPEPFFAHGTARDALLSGLRHAPFKPAPEGNWR